jgi:hypothetical protein
MKRLPAIGLAFLVCAFALGLSPRPASSALCFFCDTSVLHTTAVVSGTGSDCTAAQAAMTSQLQQLAGATCGAYCNFNVIITKACFQLTTGEHRVKGYATYNCRESACEPTGNQ